MLNAINGWAKSEYFLPAPHSKVVFKRALSCNIRPRHLKQSSSHRIRLRACYKCARFTQHTLVWNACVMAEKELCWFQYSAGKNYHDFILLLMAFPYSNICYCEKICYFSLDHNKSRAYKCVMHNVRVRNYCMEDTVHSFSTHSTK